MIVIMSESFGIPGALKKADIPLMDRLAELGRASYLKSNWKVTESSEFLWNLMSNDPFIGKGPLVAIENGINIQGRAVGLVEFVNVNKNMEITEHLKAPKDIKTKVGPFEFEIRTVNEKSFILFSGSEKLIGNIVKKNIVQKMEASDPNAKRIAKALRTFSQMVNEKTGKFPVMTNFGRIRKTPLRVEVPFFTDSSDSGIIKLLGLKKVSSFEELTKLKGLRFAKFSRMSLSNLDKIFLPLIALSEKETVILLGISENGLEQPLLIIGPKFVADNHKKFDGSQNGMQYTVNELKQMIQHISL